MGDALSGRYPLKRLRPPPLGRRLQRRATVAALGGLIVIGAYAVAQASGGALLGPALLLQWAVPGAAAAAAWLVWVVQSSGHRYVWGAFAAALTLWTTGRLAELLPPTSLPDPPAFDGWIWLGTGVLGLGALVGLFRVGPLSRDATTWTEALLLVACGATLAGYFLVWPLSAQGGTLLPLLQVGAGLALFAAAVVVRYGTTGALPRAAALALSGLLPAVVSGERQVWMLAEGLRLTDGLNGALNIAAGLLFVAAAHAVAYPPAPAETSPAWDRYAGWLPLIGLGSVILLPLFRPSNGRWTDMVGLSVLLCLTLGVLRLALSLGENRRLRQEKEQLVWQNEEYARLAISDPLTGLFNKGYYAHRLQAEWERSVRYSYPLTLIALDLDNFKGVNDHYGHAAGDTLLIAIGHALRAGCRTVDIPCRCGGDEFAVIVPQTDPTAGLLLASRLRSAVAEVLAQHGLHPHVSVSAGVAGYPADATTVTDLHAQADAALYAAKRAGKDRAVRWTPAQGADSTAPLAGYDVRASLSNL